MSNSGWEVFDPCGATTDDGIECEGAIGHLNKMHWYSIWSFDKESEEWYPSHPVYFD
jgi:hypothetical protein